MEHDVFHGIFMEYFTQNPMESPWKISYVLAPMEFRGV